MKKPDEVTQFLMDAYCGLALRGYDNERSIPDSILRMVWRFGKRAFLASKAARRDNKRPRARKPSGDHP